MKRYIKSSEDLTRLNERDAIDRVNNTKSRDDLMQLAQHPNGHVRESVAIRAIRDADTSLINQLIEDESWRVRYTLAKYCKDQDVLARLADDPEVAVRKEVASFIEDPQVLEQLKRDTAEAVRYSANKPRGYFKRRRVPRP